MPLADPTDGGIAGHLAQRLDGVSEEERTRAGACRREGGFGAGVSAADHDHIELPGKVHAGKRP
jgi:hypothetical protein